MQLMFADEADVEQGRNQLFYVAGAIFIAADRTRELSDTIFEIREARGFRAGDPLKFAVRNRPDHVSADEHRSAKQDVMAAAAAHGVTFCAYVMLHELALEQGQERLVQYGANTLLGKFNEFCGEPGVGPGIAMFDRMPIGNEFAFFREKFSRGLTFPNSDDRRLENVISYASTCDGASNLSSVMDIVLGAFRYCVNEPERDVAGRQLLPQVARLMWRRAGANPLRERGLVMRPSNVRVPEHRTQYEGLRDRLNALLVPVD
ncbi:hypothetical protein [Brevundimonas sp.]|uniref:hypothetical protein n=1 Tax=Brevundimonas sp. TaxID=1871086 RepID=UPI0028A25EAF|nr:hypothetical protein [Brevundimonas sp.]